MADGEGNPLDESNPMNASTWLSLATRKVLVEPVSGWYQRGAALRQLEQLRALGQGVMVNGPIALDPSVTWIGEDVCINPGLVVIGRGELHIGSHVHFGQNVRIITDNHNFDQPDALPYDSTSLPGDVVIGDCVWIGDSVVIVPGIEVGEGAILAAGAVVTRDVEPMAIVGGSPAALIRHRDRDRYRALREAGRYHLWPRPDDRVFGRHMTVARRPG